MSMKTKIEKILFLSTKENVFSVEIDHTWTERNSENVRLHLEEPDIVKGVKNGQNFHPLERKRLLQSAIPKFFMGNITNVLILFKM